MVASTITPHLGQATRHIADGKLHLVSLVQSCIYAGHDVLFLGEGTMSLSAALLPEVANQFADNALAWLPQNTKLGTPRRQPIRSGPSYSYDDYVEWFNAPLTAAIEWNNTCRFVRPRRGDKTTLSNKPGIEPKIMRRLLVIQLLAIALQSPRFMRCLKRWLQCIFRISTTFAARLCR